LPKPRRPLERVCAAAEGAGGEARTFSDNLECGTAIPRMDEFQAHGMRAGCECDLSGLAPFFEAA